MLKRERFFIVSQLPVFYGNRVTPRVPWTPTDVTQILLAWILAILIGNITYGLLVPPHIEGKHSVIDGNQSIEVTFLPGNRYKTESDSGKYNFAGQQPQQNRNTIIFNPENGSEITVQFAGTTRDRVGIIAVNLVFVQGSVVILIMLLLFKYRLKWKDAFGGLRNPAQTIALPCLLGSLFLFPAFLLHSVSHFIIIKMGGDPSTQQAVQMVSAAENHAEIALQAFSVVFMAPIAEELLFRGVIYSSIKQIGYQRAAIAVSAILFATVHSSWALMLPLIVLACILVWLYEKTGSLIAPMVMHATFNAINFTLIKLSPQLVQQ
jgi:membrane protease YdiL (CAAX protease family)